jgi:hypothetical protein
MAATENRLKPVDRINVTARPIRVADLPKGENHGSTGNHGFFSA